MVSSSVCNSLALKLMTAYASGFTKFALLVLMLLDLLLIAYIVYSCVDKRSPPKTQITKAAFSFILIGAIITVIQLCFLAAV